MSEEEQEDGRLDYPMNGKYRVFQKVEIQDGGETRTFYGPYGKGGQEDYNSWEQVKRILLISTREPRVFAQLPLDEKDRSRVIMGKKPYIVVTQNPVEKIDKPLGYGETDYWFPYTFKNVDKTTAERMLAKLLKNNCPDRQLNVGLELTLSEEELKWHEREVRSNVQSGIQRLLE